LELSQPTIGEAVEAIASHGVDSLVVVPALLFAAGHAKRDIPCAIEEALVGRRLDVPFVQSLHFGTHEGLIQLSRQRYLEATSQLAQIPDDETMLLLIGRGSRDSDATAEMLEFSKLRQHLGSLRHVTTAFFAMAEPSFEVTLQELQQRPFRRIVVQPHLLFFGEIMAQIVDRVKVANRQKSDQQWVVCEHLGLSSWLAQVVVDRFMQALTQ
jgi:sirohydrochlorin ferrochelatase